MLLTLCLLLSSTLLSPTQTPQQATGRIRALLPLPWWSAEPDTIRGRWGDELLGGYDCSVAGARQRKCFFWTQREACGNDDFKFRATADGVRLSEFGVLACTSDLKSARALLAKWRSLVRIPRDAQGTSATDLTAVKERYVWQTAEGVITATLEATNYTADGWQVQLYLALTPGR